MLGLTSSLIKPTTEAKHRSIAFDNLANAVVQTDVTNTFVIPEGTTGDRSFSISFWAKFNNTDANQGIIHKNYNAAGDSTSNNFHWVVQLKDSKAYFRVLWSEIQFIELIGGTVFTDAMKTSWNLWTVTLNRPSTGTSTATLYINGSALTYGAEDTDALPQAFNLNSLATKPLALGASGYWDIANNTMTRYYLNGNISKVGFWTRALSVTDMRAMWRNPKMDWQYDSAQYSKSGMQSYFMPFSNQYDQLSTQKVFDLATYTPPSTTMVDIFKPSVANNGWIDLTSGTFTDLGGDGNETKYVFTNHAGLFGPIFITYLNASNGGLTQNVAQGDVIKITFKYKWNGDAAINIKELTGGATITNLAPTETYTIYSVDHTIAAASGQDWVTFLQATAVAGTELFIKDMVVNFPHNESPADSATDTNTHYVTCTQSDQISEESPANNSNTRVGIIT